MLTERVSIGGIPAVIWGERSDKVYLCVHGKMSSKEAAEYIAVEAEKKGYQTISFDLPQHGERAAEDRRCDIRNGILDLNTVGDYVFANWSSVSLFACSLGAYFSLHAYKDRSFEKALFQSPIVDMEYLIRQMMRWFSVSEERLEREKEIDTPIDLMSWDYYRYVLDHPVEKWDIPTAILFGAKDELQSQDVMQAFAERFGCSLTISQTSEHPFMAESDGPIVARWLRDNL